MLAVNLEPSIAPLAHDLPDERLAPLHRSRIGWAQIQAVPPGHVLRCTDLVQQQQVSMLPKKIGIWLCGKRRDPEPRLHAPIPDRLNERDHVGIPPWELLWVEIPITQSGLPAIVRHCPDQPEVARFR